MSKELKTTIMHNNKAAKDIFELTLLTEKGLNFEPGQFANIGVPDASLLLKRPLSINAYDTRTGIMTFIYKRVGKGTDALSKMAAGETVEIIAALGKGFPELEAKKTVFLVGGGIGCAPLESVMDAYPNHDYHTFFGFDTEKSIYHKQAFSDKSKTISFATEDGSFDQKGFVTEPLLKALEITKPDYLFACGPTPMLKALKKAIETMDICAYVSVEERMGCGMGGCAVCACKTTSGYKKACVDGPVFPLSEVIFD
ncbi:MAG: dihydroorotate dehydrogenase electron transfer subunit [Eubacteriales bacterium]